MNRLSGLYRSRCKRLERYGYSYVLRHVDSAICGSPVGSSFLVTLLYLPGHSTPQEYLAPIGTPGLQPRRFHNCLVPYGVLYSAWVQGTLIPISEDRPARYRGQTGWLGTLPVVDPSEPAPTGPCLIQTAKGLRRILAQEWANMRGLPHHWTISPKRIREVREALGIQEWSSLGTYLGGLLGHAADTEARPEGSPHPRRTPETPEHPVRISSWTWEPPSLAMGPTFYKNRLLRLQEVTAALQGPESWLTEGEQALAHHRQNYGPEGLSSYGGSGPPTTGKNCARGHQ